ncbi:MAG TPA: histidine phosphatase family protein [Candidatus Saccharimonadales bacterium]|nr:histidine phosphatase family protein [Candidatus Saccharimonadales bacterium]
MSAPEQYPASLEMPASLRSLQNAGIDLLPVRHCEAEHNRRPGLLDGHEDSELTDRGRRESVQTGAYFGHMIVDLVITSEKSRAVKTYEYGILPFLPNVPHTRDAGLNEQDYGWASGMEKKAVYTEDMDRMLRREGYTGRLVPEYARLEEMPEDWQDRPAETGFEVADRFALGVLRQAAKVRRPEGRNLVVAAVTHSATMKNVAGLAYGIPRHEMFGLGSRYKPANGAVWELRPGDTKPRQLFKPRLATPATAPIPRSDRDPARNSDRSRATVYA